MTDFAIARANMVNAQLSPNGVHHPALIEAYKKHPREALIDDALKTRAYIDEDLELPAARKRYVMEPMIEARLLQEALKGAIGCGLVLGAASLPSAVMLAGFASTVIVLEPDPDIATRAQKRLTAQEVCNIVLIETSYREGYARQAPYDVIFAPGALSGIPGILTDQLSIGGRLLCVLRERQDAAGRAVSVQKVSEATVDMTVLADAATPYLAGFEPPAEFVF